MVLRFGCVLTLVASLMTPLVAQQSESIGVKGHWLFEIYNRDGSLAQRREINNGLTTGGWTLAHVLARRATVQQWMVMLVATPGMFGAPTPGFSPQAAFIVEPGTPGAGSTPSLSIDLVGQSLVLKGHATALTAGTIAEVHTGIIPQCTGTCSTPPFTGFPGFSGKILSTPIQLEGEQDLRVTVTISFSSAN